MSPTNELNFSQPFSDLVRRRYSCRTFSDRPINDGILSSLTAYLADLQPGSPGDISLHLIKKSDLKRENLFTTGTYGMIKGVGHFIAGVLTPKGDGYWEKFGYIMEQALMFATDLGLDTCWIGGVFDRNTFAKVAAVGKDRIVPAVVAVGYAAEKPVIRDKIVRWGSKGDMRKDPGSLFHFERFGQPLYNDLFPGYAPVLENVRLAPSASNKQPWRILVEPRLMPAPGATSQGRSSLWHIYLRRDRGYGKLIPRVDLQRIDMGIALFHLEASLHEAGISFQRAGGAAAPPVTADRMEFIATYIISSEAT